MRRSRRARGARLRISREWALAYVLCAILLLNVIAIVLFASRLEEESRTAPASPIGLPSVADAPPVPAPSAAADTRPLVRAVVLEDPARCPDCFDIRQYAVSLDGTIAISTEAGDLAAWDARLAADDRDLANSKRLPAIAFNATIRDYPQLVNDWTAIGYTITFGSGPYEGDWYVLPTLNPPYLDRTTGEVTGRVEVTYLTKRDCDTCVRQGDFRQFLIASRITPFTERTVDADTPEGRRLVVQHNITAVPTILLSENALDYPGFRPGWDVVGSVEEDGTLVLRDLERLRVVYYDIPTARVMNP